MTLSSSLGVLQALSLPLAPPDVQQLVHGLPGGLAGGDGDAA
jgi:hypothetical protein